MMQQLCAIVTCPFCCAVDAVGVIENAYRDENIATWRSWCRRAVAAFLVATVLFSAQVCHEFPL